MHIQEIYKHTHYLYMADSKPDDLSETISK